MKSIWHICLLILLGAVIARAEYVAQFVPPENAAASGVTAYELWTASKSGTNWHGIAWCPATTNEIVFNENEAQGRLAVLSVAGNERSPRSPSINFDPNDNALKPPGSLKIIRR